MDKSNITNHEDTTGWMGFEYIVHNRFSKGDTPPKILAPVLTDHRNVS